MLISIVIIIIFKSWFFTNILLTAKALSLYFFGTISLPILKKSIKYGDRILISIILMPTILKLFRFSLMLVNVHLAPV